jgi:hypothetical protein
MFLTFQRFFNGPKSWFWFKLRIEQHWPRRSGAFGAF